nr:MAG TPA: hypothetical protein [Caudoviricetes sp.]
MLLVLHYPNSPIGVVLILPLVLFYLCCSI